jgi:hypothetical protein
LIVVVIAIALKKPRACSSLYAHISTRFHYAAVA